MVATENPADAFTKEVAVAHESYLHPPQTSIVMVGDHLYTAKGLQIVIEMGNQPEIHYLHPNIRRRIEIAPMSIGKVAPAVFTSDQDLVGSAAMIWNADGGYDKKQLVGVLDAFYLLRLGAVTGVRVNGKSNLVPPQQLIGDVRNVVIGEKLANDLDFKRRDLEYAELVRTAGKAVVHKKIRI